MCESVQRGTGWLGWNCFQQAETGLPAGPWVDLSYTADPDMPCASIFEKPSFRLVREMPDHPFNVTEMRMVVHSGTHIDSPRHYYLDGPAFEEIPLDRLHGPGVVWSVPCQPEEVIALERLASATPAVREGDILAIDTGWDKRFGTPQYERHPSLSPEAAGWLAARNIKLFACDFATPDLVYDLRPEGFDWPVHRALLSRGILICEHLRGHGAFAGSRVEFMFNALNIKGSDGAPVRALCRRVEG
jgi:kynurenine formamidase